MKNVIFICLILAQLAGMAADNTQAELLCVWNYKTQYTTTVSMHALPTVVFSKVETVFYFSDNTFVRADVSIPYEEVLKMKNTNPKRWLTADNNLILLDENGKQEMAIVAFQNQPVQNLLKGEKEIQTQVVLKNGTAPQSYNNNDLLALSPQ